MGKRMTGIVLMTALASMMAGCMNEQPASGMASPSAGSSAIPSATAQGPTASTAPTSSPAATKAPTASALPTNTPQPSPKPNYSKEADAKKAIEQRANETIQALKEHDMSKLAKLVHPKKGIQFSPYSHIDTAKDVKVPGSGLSALWSSSSTTNWGVYDGSGDPIDLTFPDYWNKFVYNQDFAAPPQIGYNKILGKGNMVNNVFSIYPAASFITVEYYFPGIDPQYQGMDWTSLRLVFENSGGQWYLVAAVHDQHTM